MEMESTNLKKRGAVVGMIKAGREDGEANRASGNPTDYPTTAIRKLCTTNAIATYL